MRIKTSETQDSNKLYKIIDKYSNLPNAKLNTNQLYLVLTDEKAGILKKHKAGFYVSNGETWTLTDIKITM